MIRTIIIFFGLILGLFAEDKATCYSVEIFKESFTQELANQIGMKEYEPSCLRMQIRDMLAVRCGCVESKEIIDLEVEKFKKKYHDAKRTITYAYRFENMENIYKDETEQVVSVKKQKKKCYSIELENKAKNDENLLLLSEQMILDKSKVLDKGNYLSLSYGCYESKKFLITDYKRLKQKYQDAHIETIYRDNFFEKELNTTIESLDFFDATEHNVSKMIQQGEK